MPITPEYLSKESDTTRSKRSSVFIGLGAAWAVLLVLGIPLTFVAATIRLPEALLGGVVVSAAVIAGVFAARVHRRG